MAKIALICGGLSREREVSKKSAEYLFSEYQRGGVIKNGKPTTKHRLTLVELDSKGFWVEQADGRTKLDLNDFSYIDKESEENDKASSENKVTKGVKVTFDGVFFLIHGTPIEDGKLQGYFELLNLPYVGSSASVSQLTFNKNLTGSLFRSHNQRVANNQKINLAKSWLFDRKSWRKEQLNPKLKSHLDLPYPCFVKPNSSGSSFGAKKVTSREELELWLEECFSSEDEEFSQFLVEEYLVGREFTCGIFNYEKSGVADENKIITLPVTEIKTNRAFFDFEAKYLGDSEEITPANISDKLTDQIQGLTKAVFIKLGMSGFARTDFIVKSDKVKGDEIYFIETNTVPGFTRGSLFPQQLKVAEISVVEFVDRLIDGVKI